jgi:hypothetical protein
MASRFADTQGEHREITHVPYTEPESHVTGIARCARSSKGKEARTVHRFAPRSICCGTAFSHYGDDVRHEWTALTWREYETRIGGSTYRSAQSDTPESVPVATVEAGLYSEGRRAATSVRRCGAGGHD